MATVRLLRATKRAPTGTPGSAAVERGFDVEIETRPALEASQVRVVWTWNGWRTVEHTVCTWTRVEGGADVWSAGMGFFSERPITEFYALAATTPAGVVWDNNGGWNYMI
jgi:hypothetical protein